MNNTIKQRTLNEAEYMLISGKTVREIGSLFNVSKSTVHKDLQERLKEFDQKKYEQVLKILNYHKKIRHLRGGESTKNKYNKK